MIAGFKKIKPSWAALPIALFVVLTATGLTAAQKEKPPDESASRGQAKKTVKMENERSASSPKGDGQNSSNSRSANVPPQVTVEARFLSMPWEIAEELLQQKDGSRAVAINQTTLERIRKLEEEKKINVVSSPKITTRNMESATLKATKDFVYPSAYKIQNGKTVPTAFETREVGVILDFNPRFGGTVIAITLAPEIVEF